MGETIGSRLGTELDVIFGERLDNLLGKPLGLRLVIELCNSLGFKPYSKLGKGLDESRGSALGSEL